MSKARDVADSYTDVEVDAKDATLQTQVNDRYTKSESDGRYLQNGDAITSNNGNVGIGTSSPTYPLHVQGQVGIELYNTTGGGNALNFRPSLGDANKYNLSITSYDHSADGTAHADGLSINGYDGVSFCTGSNSRQERMRIDSEGRVTMPYQPAFIAYDPSGNDRSSTGLFSDEFTSTLANTGNHYNPSTGYFTAPVAGYYQFGWNLFSTANGTTYSRAGIWYNGSTEGVMGFSSGSNVSSTAMGSILMYMNVGDTAALGTQNSNYTAYWYGSRQHSRFWGYLVG